MNTNKMTKNYIDRVHRLEEYKKGFLEEIKEIDNDIKNIYKEALKEDGIDLKKEIIWKKEDAVINAVY